ncbi:MAG: site-2 protease family protein [Dehalococcoidia bacterium]
MDLSSGFTLARVRGIEIRVHWSWLLIFGLLAFSFSEGLFGSELGRSTQVSWAAGIATAGLFFLSVLLHELSHSFVAQRYGMNVPSITLFIFGGVSNLAGEMRTPGQEFRIAIAGPLMSWLLAILFFALWIVVPGDVAGAMFGYLSFINLLVGAFNLLPGFPLDGGRVFRSIVWARSKDLMQATRVASRVGVGIAYLMIIVGLVNVVFFGLIGGLWYVLIGLFLKSASEQSYASMLLEGALKDVAVEDVMQTAPAPVDRGLSLQSLVDGRVLATGERAFLVEGDGRILGLVTATDLAKVPRGEWASTAVEQLMIAAEQVATIAPQAGVVEAMKLMQERDVHQLPVIESGRVVGIITRGDVMRQIQLRTVFHRDSAEARSGSS